MASPQVVIPDDFDGHSLRDFPVPAHYAPYVSSVLLPHQAITSRVTQLAQDVHAAYQGRELQLVCVLKGAHPVFSELLTQLNALNREATAASATVAITYNFLLATSYEGTRSTGTVKSLGRPQDLQGQDVLVVEDIIDTGKTMSALEMEIRQYEPRSLAVFTLLTKRIRGGNGFHPAYAGFSVPDRFLVGFGLDYNEQFRDLEHICVLNEAGKERFK